MITIIIIKHLSGPCLPGLSGPFLSGACLDPLCDSVPIWSLSGLCLWSLSGLCVYGVCTFLKTRFYRFLSRVSSLFPSGSGLCLEPVWSLAGPFLSGACLVCLEENQVKQQIVRHKTSRRPSWGQGAWNFLVERFLLNQVFRSLVRESGRKPS